MWNACLKKIKKLKSFYFSISEIIWKWTEETHDIIVVKNVFLFLFSKFSIEFPTAFWRMDSNIRSASENPSEISTFLVVYWHKWLATQTFSFGKVDIKSLHSWVNSFSCKLVWMEHSWKWNSGWRILVKWYP